MCYPCTRCNKCGKYPPPGTCYKCGHVNSPSARACENCGNQFPPPPGIQVETKVASEESAKSK